jgi:hypothetical protein
VRRIQSKAHPIRESSLVQIWDVSPRILMGGRGLVVASLLACFICNRRTQRAPSQNPELSRVLHDEVARHGSCQAGQPMGLLHFIVDHVQARARRIQPTEARV